MIMRIRADNQKIKSMSELKFIPEILPELAHTTAELPYGVYVVQ